jgi:CBS domain-containing protein
MKKPIETLTNFRVRDVMRSEVVTLRDVDTMGHAASVLSSYGITGAPVVDSDGKCVGVLSSSDFVSREIASPNLTTPANLAFESMYIKKTFAPAETIEASQVGAYMSMDVHTVTANETMLKAARMLCEERIHRLVVVDVQARPVGILSSLDIVACLVVAVEE